MNKNTYTNLKNRNIFKSGQTDLTYLQILLYKVRYQLIVF